MAKTQKHPIGNDFNANVIQENIFELFQYAHEHPVKSSLPTRNEGSPRDIVLVDDGTSVYLCVKTSRGWFRSAALTAI
jgi:hypothetical protein